MRKRQLKGINSQNYNSIDAVQNLRLKPQYSLDRAQTLFSYYKRQSNVDNHNRRIDFLQDIENEQQYSRTIGDHMSFQKIIDPNYTDMLYNQGQMPQITRGLTPNQVSTRVCDLIKDC